MQRLRVFATFLFFAGVLSAQQLTSLTGTVADPTGAVIPGAAVRLESLDRGFTRDAATDSTGRFAFLQVQPGKFKITAKASGFSEVIVNDVVLEVNQPGKVNIVFEKIGAVAETISVSAEGAQINTTDATVGNTIGATAILQVPLFARNLAGLLAFQPGVTSFGDATGQADRNGSVNGGRSDQANVTVDGVDSNQQTGRAAFRTVIRMTLDSTQEFRTTTTGANADQGRSSGAQVQLVTKSGSNDFHGSLYWYHRNTITAANSFFNNQSGVKRPPLLINIPGGSLGGPIVKNKAFFFLNYETRRDASQVNVSRTVPSLDLRQGIVNYQRVGGGVGRLLPADLRRIDPAGIGANQAALQLLQSYPAPNDFSLGDGLNVQGFRFAAPVGGKQDTYIARFDFTPTASHQFFVRGNLQNDRDSEAPQFPGDQPNRVNLENVKGLAAGHTFLISPTLVLTTRYGLTRQAFEQTGIQTASAVTFRNLDPRFATTRGLGRKIPVHMLTQDFAWTKGRHDIRFGGAARFITNNSRNFNNSFNDGIANLSWLRGTGSDLQAGVPDLLPAGRVAYGDAMMMALGIITQGNARYNYKVNGELIPLGQPVTRKFANEEYEMYAQDTWRLRQNLTVTLGLRYSLMPPIYEANGEQLSSNIPIGQWFDTRGGLADQGLPQSQAGAISYVPTSRGGRPLYPFHKDNVAPRVSLAWSPSSNSSWGRKLLGNPGQTSIRAGWGMFYDIIGQPLTLTYDANAFGLATGLTNPAGVQTSLTAPRFTGFFNLPGQLIRPAGPQNLTPPQGSFLITNSIDDNLQMPYVMRMNFSIGREFGRGWFIEASYVGSQSRKNLVNRDLAMPTNLRDPASGQTYFQAASQLETLRRARTPIGQIPRVPFFERFFSNLAGGGLSASQAWYQQMGFYGVDTTSALADLDHFCDPDCGIRANQMLNSQFSALSAWSSIGHGSYHAMQWTMRKRFSDGLLLDFNYTLAKSTDLASRAENAGSFSGFLVNSWEPDQRKGVSDYDARHIYSAYMYYQLPFGKGKRFLSGANRLVDAVIGGWEVSTSWQQSSELPTSVGNGRNWPTNWNITGFATPVGSPRVSTRTKNAPAVAGASGPNMFRDPAGALNEWQFTLPGQSGSRNTVRIDGAFNINTGLFKRFTMPYNEAHNVQIRWETFNLTNAVRFGFPNLDLGNASNFGKYTTTINSPRQMQFAFRYEF
ncbi:MAG: carboxypeptidase-like regulatory domain-containing protein [Bryobacteraceae bacterium]|nr:carboxypeptidase-like regulatory domain-containing protein [Bryobacteraceae bacterium]